MDIKTELDTAFNASTQFHSFEKLSTFLDSSIIDEAVVEAGVATVGKRRSPLESVMWCVMGMSLFRQESV